MVDNIRCMKHMPGGAIGKLKTKGDEIIIIWFKINVIRYERRCIPLALLQLFMPSFEI